MAYIGREGYLIHAELREGRQHCQCNTPAFLRETIALCREVTDEPLLFRLDSGHDSAENLGILLEAGCHFIVKRNMRREGKDNWLAMAKAYSQDVTTPREGKTVYIGSGWRRIAYAGPNGEKKTATVRTGYEVTERSIDKHGQFLLPADVEVNTWWTNLGVCDRDVIA